MTTTRRPAPTASSTLTEVLAFLGWTHEPLPKPGAMPFRIVRDAAGVEIGRFTAHVMWQSLREFGLAPWVAKDAECETWGDELVGAACLPRAVSLAMGGAS